jgi:hypothetical protein
MVVHGQEKNAGMAKILAAASWTALYRLMGAGDVPKTAFKRYEALPEEEIPIYRSDNLDATGSAGVWAKLECGCNPSRSIAIIVFRGRLRCSF